MSSPVSSPAKASAYGRLDRALHRIALGSSVALELSFDLEKARFGRAARALVPRPPVFVAGLARAGTTILMQRIHAADDFASLQYRDLPFPLAPNTWAGVTAGRKRSVERTERGHGDGLEHDLDSPEAIEEVFWRMRGGKAYARAQGLSAEEPEAATMADFRLFMRLVCLNQGRDRYLSKNNANVLRLSALLRGLPGAVMVHPFRAPVEQAASLLAQHRRARALGQADAFRAEFMRWLGHHEFGVHQRPFLLPAGIEPVGSPDSLAFWLRTWTGVHTHLLNKPASVAARQCFVDYDRMAAGDASVLTRLAERLDLPRAIPADGLRSPRPHAPALDEVPEADLEAAQAVHARLVERAAIG